MSSIIYGCLSSHVLDHADSIKSLRGYFTGREQCTFKEYRGTHYIAGLIQRDRKERYCFSREDNMICLVSGSVYGSDHLSTGSDAEIVLDAYRRAGVSLAGSIEGPFVSLICDINKNRMCIINDVFGAQPFYYTRVNDGIIFCSEAEAFIECGLIKAKLNCQALADLFVAGFVIGEDTLFDQIFKLDGASVLLYDGAGVNKKCLTNYFPDEATEKKLHERYHHTDFLIASSVKQIQRYVCGGRAVFALSGGLDSRIILKYILEQKFLPKIVTYSNQLEGLKNDVAYARMLSRHFQFRLNVIPENPGSVTCLPFMLQRAELRGFARISGHLGDIIKGSPYRILCHKEADKADQAMKRIFSRRFIKRLARHPFERVTQAVNSINSSREEKRISIFCLQNISSFFKLLSPGQHRFGNSFFKNRHYPYLNKKLISYLMNMPLRAYINRRFMHGFVNHAMPDFASLPSTTVDLECSPQYGHPENYVSFSDQQFFSYLETYQRFSPLWEMDIFNDQFITQRERMGACLFNVWHDHYFGFKSSVRKMKRIENKWLKTRGFLKSM
ncbi:MAG: hypothetical protein HQM16_01905 [Deltaproteobacteria bacterium]|nr:hypothetical protein [Deltaproteobacteria bacterium]